LREKGIVPSIAAPESGLASALAKASKINDEE